MASHKVLGLDMGTNSIGWALVGYEVDGDDRRPTELIASGVRVFQENVDAKSREPKNKARRAARSLRRITQRRRRRIRKLEHVLREGGLLTGPLPDEREEYLNRVGNPYVLRAKALDHALTVEELVRVLLHLCRRRGFKSNRKGDKDPDEKGIVLTAIASLETDIAVSGARTLGEYLSRQATQRRRRTSRAMYEHEFKLIWDRQREFHAALRDDALEVKIARALFWQRPLKSATHLIGKCTFFPNRSRAPKWSLSFQQSRMLAAVNNLAVRNPVDGNMRGLTAIEREKLVEKLNHTLQLTWTQARKLLGLHSGEKFNLEAMEEEKLIGNRSAAAIHKVLEDRWTGMPVDRREELIVELNTIELEASLLKRLEEGWGFDAETAKALATARFEDGYGRLSVKALRRILPHLEEGLQYDKAMEAAGFHHSDLRPDRILETLPAPPSIRNPIVQKALYEVRRVVNAIIRTHGRPDTIRVELAREAKRTRKEKDREAKQQRDNKKLNELATEAAKEAGLRNPSRTDLLKYRLWLESDMMCPYTGQSIPLSMLWSPVVEIEHIIPYSRCLDDSYMNVTLCLTEENRRKGSRTPFEAYGGNPDRFEQILQRIQPRKGSGGLPAPKRRRFEQREVAALDDFVSRQLNDTRYISAECRDYLMQICERTEVGRGDLTAATRHLLGLNQLLDPDGDGEKNRADHRHHAVDAVVIALTSPIMVKRVPSRYRRGESLSVPWPSFMGDLREHLDRMIISHATNHRLSGAFHEDTAYGYLESEDVFVYRKPLGAGFKKEWVDDIKDDGVREAVRRHLERYGNDEKKAFADGVTVLHLDSRTPIRRVRLRSSLSKKSMLPIHDHRGRAFKFYKLGNNHHMEIWQSADGSKRMGVVVSTHEAAQRAHSMGGRTIGNPPAGGYQLAMVLHANDMVHHAKHGFYRVQQLGDVRLMARHHTAATLDDNHTRLLIGSGEPTRHIVPVEIDVLGRVRAPE